VKLLQFAPPNPDNIAASLRALATEIERGDLGEVQACAVSLLSDGVSIFGFGPRSDIFATVAVLQAGATLAISCLSDSTVTEPPVKA
jgi:hypothetical protein